MFEEYPAFFGSLPQGRVENVSGNAESSNRDQREIDGRNLLARRYINHRSPRHISSARVIHGSVAGFACGSFVAYEQRQLIAISTIATAGPNQITASS